MMKKTFIPAMFILTIIFTFCTVQTVQSHGKGGQQIEKQYYDAWESAYIKDIKLLLVQNGLAESGITMTKVMEADGSRSYEVLIHHRRTAFLTQKQYGELMEKLQALPFPAQDCDFAFCLGA